MSATFNEQLFSDYFNHCPTLYIPGRIYPVEEYYLETILKETQYSSALSTTIYRYVPSRNVFEELEDSFPKSTSSTLIEDMLYRYSCKYIDYNMVTATISYIIKVLFLLSTHEYLD